MREGPLRRPLDGLRARRQFARRADAIVVSIPKGGRTWLRVLIQAYRTRGIPEEFVLRAGPANRLPPPAAHFTHERWTHQTTRSLKEFLLRDQLLPDDLLPTKPVVLLARDPRDVIVSLYFEETRRRRRFMETWSRQRRFLYRAVSEAFTRVKGREVFQGPMAAFIRSPLYGIRPVVTTMNDWLDRFSRLPRFRLLRYEDLQADTTARLRDLLQFMGVREVDEEILARAIAFASFENMRRLEESGAFDERLRPAAAADPESYKVRRGKIGGYVDYLSADDIAFLEAEIARLDPRFGYATPAAALVAGHVPAGKAAPPDEVTGRSPTY